MSIRHHYDEVLVALHHQLIDLGSLAAIAIERAIDALAHQNIELAREVTADDVQIDEREQQLQLHAATLIATQQPVARDLRNILSAIAAAGELERIADYGKGIAKLVIGPEGARPLPAPAELLHLASAARAMLDHTLSALAQLDASAAQALLNEEEQIDQIYKPLKARLAANLSENPVGPARAADLLFIAYHLERIADRATNIAERIIYYASGELVALNP